jgi:hypothetical protein
LKKTLAMKNLTLLLFSVTCIFMNANLACAQCIPDTINCKDTLKPGQICPEIMPDGYLGEPYDQTVTILPPSSTVIADVTIPIVKIIIDTITNLPPGITYQPNANEFYPDTAYCVLLSGIPTETGVFDIAITVIPYIDFLGNVVEAPAVVDDTSITITVYETSGMNEMQSNGFYILSNQPNPFSGTTLLGFMTNEYAPVRLNIYNYLGILVYSETIHALPGRNYFRFNGENLRPGYYIYSIVNNDNVYSERLIKSR